MAFTICVQFKESIHDLWFWLLEFFSSDVDVGSHREKRESLRSYNIAFLMCFHGEFAHDWVSVLYRVRWYLIDFQSQMLCGSRARMPRGYCCNVARQFWTLEVWRSSLRWDALQAHHASDFATTLRGIDAKEHRRIQTSHSISTYPQLHSQQIWVRTRESVHRLCDLHSILSKLRGDRLLILNWKEILQWCGLRQ